MRSGKHPQIGQGGGGRTGRGGKLEETLMMAVVHPMVETQLCMTFVILYFMVIQLNYILKRKMKSSPKHSNV